MSLFQNSVLNKYLRAQDITAVDAAWQRYTTHFFDPQYQHNVRAAKEEQYQEGFLRDLFVQILGYTLNPKPGFDLTTELKNIRGAKKTDGAILRDGHAIAVIELKGTDTINLDKIEDQAFGYKRNQTNCTYVITSNFEKLRFYIDDSIDFIDFPLFQLTKDEFDLLYLCLSKDSIRTDLPKRIKSESVTQEEAVTKQLYKDYSAFRREIFESIVQRNPEHNKLTLFKSTQKLLDRFLFIFFAEDRGLLPPNSIRQIIVQWTDLRDKYDEYTPLYERFKKYFGYLNTGHKGTKHEIFAYNGGLFAPDDLLDSILIDDDILYAHTQRLSDYDFESEVSVNILGHIFEHSLNEIEEIQAEIDGQQLDKAKTKRKKDGVFYTPKYITKYIVDHTVGTLCNDKKSELNIDESEYEKDRKGRTKKKLAELQDKLEAYRSWLLTLTICDPACGSGAFLNQALEHLIAEHTYIDTLQTKLLGGGFTFPNVENAILEHNLYGVDINQESVEIAKLSLWLRTAQRGRKLSSLNHNIKCGNSLIDDPEVAGDKAFRWEAEFPDVFDKGGFDVVIGNPPYGAFLNSEEKISLSKNYKSFQGNFEIYFFFIEKVNQLLKNGGSIGYITPDSWISIPQAERLRRFVLELYNLSKIVNFNYSVFSDASVNAIVFIMSQNSSTSNCMIKQLDVLDINGLNDLSSYSYQSQRYWTDTEDAQFQIWQSDSDILLLKKIRAVSQYAIEYLDVSQGIVPYSKEHLTKEEIDSRIYHSDNQLNQNYGKWIQGRAVNRYHLDLTNHEYLNYGNWLHRSRKHKFFENQRIIIQEITGGDPPRICCTKYSDVLYHDPGIISCLIMDELIDLDLVLIQLNSRLVSWVHLKSSPKGNRKTFPKVLIGDIRKFPIIGKSEKPYKHLIDKIMALNEESFFFVKAFLKLLQSKYPIDKLSKKLQSWYDLDFGEFLAELKKKKVKLSLQEQAEWMPYFEEQRAAVQEIRTQIDRIDAEIDQMVYHLYGLTDEEIAIVEEAVG